MKQTLMLIIAILCLLIVLILTILDAIRLFHELYPCGANVGPFRAHKAAKRIRAGENYVVIDGMRYNVSWIVKGQEGYIYEEKE